MPERETSPLVRRDGSTPDQDVSPVCLCCGQDTQHVRTIHNLGFLPEILVFRCPSCHSVRAVQPVGVGRSAASNDKSGH